MSASHEFVNCYTLNIKRRPKMFKCVNLFSRTEMTPGIVVTDVKDNLFLSDVSAEEADVFQQ